MEFRCCQYTKAKIANREINEVIKVDAKKSYSMYSVLILGAENAGKSTIYRQMIDYSMCNMNVFKADVLFYFVQSVAMLSDAFKKANMRWKNATNSVLALQLKEISLFMMNSLTGFHLTENQLKIVESLCLDPVMQEIINLSCDFYPFCNASYFVLNCNRICNENYEPTKDDILRAKINKNSVEKTQLHSSGVGIQVIDIGDNINMKWNCYFETTFSVVFVVSLLDYDIPGKKMKTKLEDSIESFKNLLESTLFADVQIMLLLNKRDMFKLKLPRVPLNEVYPEYFGGSNVKEAINYIKRKFAEVIGNRTNVHTHASCAFDSNIMRLSFYF